MSAVKLHRDEFVIGNAAMVLRDLAELCHSLIYSVVVTDDGFVVTDRADGKVASSSMGSMASSLQALGDAVSRELRIGSSEYTILASESGYVIQLRIPGQHLVLAAVFGNSETVGKALASSRASAQRLGHLLLAAEAAA